MIKNKKAFTLVELIITIIIISILGTIAFISLQWYSRQARDSIRITDVSTIKSWLDIYKVEAGKYPKPTNWINITFSWWSVWLQWSIWNSVVTNLSNINKTPIDPLKLNEYTYSLLNNNKEYQIWIILEEWERAFNGKVINNIYADEIVKTYITWTYNWILAKTTINSITYVIAIPCIISADTSETTIEWSLIKKILACDWTTNAPATYSSYSHSWGFDFNSSSTWNILVYEWSLNNLTSNWNLQISLVQNLQTAYSWTSLNNSDLSNILNIDTTNDINWSKFLAQVLIQNTLDSSIKIDYNLLSQPSSNNNNIKVYAWVNHTCAINWLGWVKCWWKNSSWQLWDWTFVNKITPVDVLTLTWWVLKVWVWENHTCALTSSWSVKCWWEWQALWIWASPNKNTPNQVTWLSSWITDLSVGNYNSCIVNSWWWVKCWWNNSLWALWDWTITARTTPVDVTWLTSWYKKVFIWLYHGCAISTWWWVKCWWNNQLWKLWDNTTTNSYTPVNVVWLTSWVKDIVWWYFHTCWLLESWWVKCWWRIWLWDLINSKIPIDVPWLTTNVKYIWAWKDDVCALINDWTIKCFWFNTYWELWNGNWYSESNPTSVIELSGNADTLSVWYNHTCIVESWIIKCWWNNDNWQFWDWTINLNYKNTPVTTTISNTLSNINIWDAHWCVLENNWWVKCWWYNWSWQAWNNTKINVIFNPVTPTWLANWVVDIRTWYSYSCALSSIWWVKCWWFNESLWVWTFWEKAIPTDVYNLTSWATKLSCWKFSSCALLSTWWAKCWWRNDYWQLWSWSNAGTLNSVDVTWLSTGALDISIWTLHTCALLNNWKVQCWGYNWYSQLWDWTTTNSYTPLQVNNIPNWIIDVKAGGMHTCILTWSWWVMCWWQNNYWQLWNWTTTNNPTPNYVTWLTSWVSKLAIWELHWCVIMNTWEVKCWWHNSNWKIWDWTTTNKTTPTTINLGGIQATDIFTWYENTCAKLTTWIIKCWWKNYYWMLQDWYNYTKKSNLNIN